MRVLKVGMGVVGVDVGVEGVDMSIVDHEHGIEVRSHQ
jgi:hypothetical protein